MSAEPVVVKLGGSLLSQPDWPEWLEAWLDEQPPGPKLLIVGGGQAIDAMRQLDRAHRLDTPAMHWRCIRLLDATFEVAAELLQRSGRRFAWRRVDSADQLFRFFPRPSGSPAVAPVSTSNPTRLDRWRSPTEPPTPAADHVCFLVRVAGFYQPRREDRRLSDSSRPAGPDARQLGLPAAGEAAADIPEDWRTTTDSLALYLGQLVAAPRVVLLKSCPVGHLSGVPQAVTEGIIDAAVPLVGCHFQPHTLELVQLGRGRSGASVSSCYWTHPL
jgi:5-(aminomethyl)-3-furanmethanol phosphate kinase